MLLSKPFRNAAFAVGVGLLASGCATRIPVGGQCSEGSGFNIGIASAQSLSYNRTCGVNNAAGQMLATDDPGVRATGMLTLEETNPEIKKSAVRVREALANTGVQRCVARRREDGTASLENCVVVTVPQSEGRNAGQPVTPSP